MTLRTLNYGNYGIFLIMGNAGFCPSTVFRVLDGNPKKELLWGLCVNPRPQSSSFLGFIFRSLYGNPKTELLWGLWVEFRVQGVAHRESVRSRV